MNSPQYTHDCDHCHFLGRYSHSGTDSDLYYCIKGSMYGGTLIARYSSSEDHYGSLQPDFPLLGKVEEGEEVLPHASEALRRTIQKGLYSPPMTKFREDERLITKLKENNS